MSKFKLTDAHRVILSAAAARQSCLVLPLPKSLRKTRQTTEAELMLLATTGSIIERRAAEGDPVWRRVGEVCSDSGVSLTATRSANSPQRLWSKVGLGR